MNVRDDDLSPVAGNGLLHRRSFLRGGAALLGSLAPLAARPARADGARGVPPWMKAPGTGRRPYGGRARHGEHVSRLVGAAPGTTGAGASRTPLERLEGIITPSALHFERHHAGVPDIDPARHRLL